MQRLVLILVAAAAVRGCPETNCMRCPVLPDSSRECQRCYHGFVKDKHCQLTVQAPVEHCAFYTIKEADGLKFAVCEKCELGFILQNDKCRKCGDGTCAVCDATGKCLACFKGLVPDPIDPSRCSSVQCELRNCEVCQVESDGPARKTHCLVCKDNSVQIEGNRDECLASKLAHCALIKEVDSAECLECKEGFFVGKDGLCLANTSHEGSSNAWVLWLLLIVFMAGLAAYLYERHVGFRPKTSEPLISG